MNLLIGFILFITDRVFKYVFFNKEDINVAFVAGSSIILIISMAIIYLLKNQLDTNDSTKWDIFIISGGLSNLFDIIIFGGVIDYIKLFGFKLNLADIFITIGIGLLIFEIWKKKK